MHEMEIASTGKEPTEPHRWCHCPCTHATYPHSFSQRVYLVDAGGGVSTNTLIEPKRESGWGGIEGIEAIEWASVWPVWWFVVGGWWMPCEGDIEGDVQGGRGTGQGFVRGSGSPRAHLDHFAAL